jgi:hypothetical protein
MNIFREILYAMKKNISIISLLGAFALLLAGAIMLSSCEGPAGPAGPQGETGPQGAAGPTGPAGADGVDGINGVDGTDGTDGVDGNAVCLICHNLAVKEAITASWETTLHATSQTYYPGSPLTVEYAGGRYDCAMCHSHEGFVETVWTGMDTTAADIPIPTGIRCETCHDFHSSLDFENEPNSAIRATAAVDLLTGDGEVEFENNPESNHCMICHQSRRNPADDTDGTAPTYVREHYGPHHGPQANFINGLGGYEFGQDLSAKGVHESGANCVSCHMHVSAAKNGEEGGHTWIAPLESCTGCHTGATDMDVNGGKTEIEGLLADLQAALLAAGMVDADGHAIEDTTYQADSVGALWNFLLVEEDMSHGIHNPAYAKALLNASISALQ